MEQQQEDEQQQQKNLLIFIGVLHNSNLKEKIIKI